MDKRWEIPILSVATVFFTQLVFILIYLGIAVRSRQVDVERRLTSIEARVATFIDNPQPPIPLLVPKYVPVPAEEPAPPNSGVRPTGKVGDSEK